MESKHGDSSHEVEAAPTLSLDDVWNDPFIYLPEELEVCHVAPSLTVHLWEAKKMHCYTPSV